MVFSRQEYWSGLPFPSPGDLPDPGIKPRSPALQADSLPTELWGKMYQVGWELKYITWYWLITHNEMDSLCGMLSLNPDRETQKLSNTNLPPASARQTHLTWRWDRQLSSLHLSSPCWWLSDSLYHVKMVIDLLVLHLILSIISLFLQSVSTLVTSRDLGLLQQPLIPQF